MALSSFFNRRNKDQDNETKTRVTQIPVANIIPNRFQPRKVFKAESINELAQTIEEHGLLQPIVVREYESGHYEIIAGERRFRAVKKLAWTKVSAIIENLSDAETAAMALIENLQREQLSPVEEAQAYENMLTQQTLTQAQLAKAVGKSQSFIANKVRLLKLSDSVQEAIINGELSERHGRALLKLDAVDQQIILQKILTDHLTVKETEVAIAALHQPEAAAQTPTTTEASPDATPAQTAPQDKPKAKTAAKGPKIHVFAKDPKLAINTLRESLDMIQGTGVDIQVEETDAKDKYRLVVTIKK
ncbi:nucleoid occlusion protein [Agrilactobacillus composti DSM 18527 = JCM 14202]|uniref:Nucleoid occlusion protein n=1 Tax=Agrilactobacillus composti DSM 18527 = JCM 14202 TaxID=1423734 RepID=A0A0R1XN66_9LACO|nr:nucleoid occlusion protein [Agrilactobacillus composti]KRM31061.1 nucleoid occlusion protein [Agrilactobacillus composti DSM 18527 = JCM 14202]